LESHFLGQAHAVAVVDAGGDEYLRGIDEFLELATFAGHRNLRGIERELHSNPAMGGICPQFKRWTTIRSSLLGVFHARITRQGAAQSVEAEENTGQARRVQRAFGD